jgi:hypothetical protein
MDAIGTGRAPHGIGVLADTTKRTIRLLQRGGRVTVGKLIYSATMSLDGYIEDEDGSFDWAVPDDEVHAFINDPERPVGTYRART